MRPPDEDIDCGIEVPEIYDGIIVWRLKDGTLVNRWADIPGYERRAARVDAWIRRQERAAVPGSTSTDTSAGTPVDGPN